MTVLFEMSPGEEVAVHVRKHWIAFVRDGGRIALIGLIPAIVFLFFIKGPLGTMLPINEGLVLSLLALWLLLLWIALGMVWTMHFLDVVILTDRRIIHIEQIAPFSRAVVACPLERVQEASVLKNGLLQTFFDYGSIQIWTAGSADGSFAVDIPSPERIRERIFEKIGAVATLSAANAEQEKLLRTISHEVKGHLAKNEAALASIIEGDYGTAPDRLKTMAGEALADTRKGVDMVMDILSTSNFKTGAMTFNKRPFDLKTAIADIVAELKPEAEKKKLALEYIASDGVFITNGDEEKIRRHVIRNLLDNAIRYTTAGTIRVALARVEKNFVMLVADTGVGIAKDDFARLFSAGGKGEHSASINPASTGYGLFVARSVVEAHNGTIWAESDGPNLGSRFYATFPAA